MTPEIVGFEESPERLSLHLEESGLYYVEKSDGRLHGTEGPMQHKLERFFAERTPDGTYKFSVEYWAERDWLVGLFTAQLGIVVAPRAIAQMTGWLIEANLYLGRTKRQRKAA